MSRTDGFYKSYAWRKLSKKVRERDGYRCVLCGADVHVLAHHVNTVEEFPDLALSEYYTDDTGSTQRNIITVCHDCHLSVCHPEQLTCPSITAERWD
jgi:5-methylcytosine-specific restriction endonuclease McrA